MGKAKKVGAVSVPKEEEGRWKGKDRRMIRSLVLKRHSSLKLSIRKHVNTILIN
jgi:hypothetical protein